MDQSFIKKLHKNYPPLKNNDLTHTLIAIFPDLPVPPTHLLYWLQINVLMPTSFLTFRKSTNESEITAIAAFFDQHNLGYELEDNSLLFDPTFSQSIFNHEYRIKIDPDNFERAENLLMEQARNELQNVASNHYLFGFSEQELLDVIRKKDEWSAFDFSLAQNILLQRGIEFSNAEIAQMELSRINQLSEPATTNGKWITLAYLLAIIGSPIGAFVGWLYLSQKRTLHNGTEVFAYNDYTRNQGRKILRIGLIGTLVWMSITLYFLIGRVI
jgi:hypothetical protein